MREPPRRGLLLGTFWRVHRWLLRSSGGRIGSRIGRLPVIVLTIRGRKSGEPRTVALFYVEDSGRYVVYASNVGEDREPSWWLNLRAAGEAGAQIGTRKLRVRARELEGAERERLWSAVVALEPSYAFYPRRTERRIAVVALEPV